MKLFQYAILLHPTKKQAEEDGTSSIILVGITTILAVSHEAAFLLAAREIPEIYMKELDRIEVAVRPF